MYVSVIQKENREASLHWSSDGDGHNGGGENAQEGQLHVSCGVGKVNTPLRFCNVGYCQKDNILPSYKMDRKKNIEGSRVSLVVSTHE